MPHRVSRELCPQIRMDALGREFHRRCFDFCSSGRKLVSPDISWPPFEAFDRRTLCSGDARKVSANCSRASGVRGMFDTDIFCG